MPPSFANSCPIYRHKLDCSTQSKHFATETRLVSVAKSRLALKNTGLYALFFCSFWLTVCVRYVIHTE